MTTTTNKYRSVISTLEVPLPAWVTDDDDQMRVAAYDGYDDMYQNVPDTFEVAMRGSEDNDRPIYVPGARRIVEAVLRYLGKDWNWTVTSASKNGADQDVAQAALSQIYINNMMIAQDFSFKRNMVRKGDALWHITADPSMPPGQRITITEIDPRTYFRIPSPTNPNRTLGCYIVSLITFDENPSAPLSLRRTIAMRQEYRYTDDGHVSAKLAFFENNAWDDRFPGHPEIREVEPPLEYQTPEWEHLLQGAVLPDTVTRIPVYHAANNREGTESFGISDLAGLETLIAGVNQSASDEDIVLALLGIGFYVTDAPPPTDEEGNEMDWVIAPGTVAQIKPGQSFQRVAGVDKALPHQDHLKFLQNNIDQAAGLTQTAIGNVSSQVVASGVALMLDMAPILAKNEEKEVELLSLKDRMASDLLHMWWPLEGKGSIAPDISVSNSFGDPLPVDRVAVYTEVIALVKQGLMSKEFALEILKEKLGYNFPTDMLDSINSDLDAESARLGLELGQPGINPAGDNQGGLVETQA